MTVSIVPERSSPVRQSTRSPAWIRPSAAETRIATLIWPVRVIGTSGIRTTAQSSPHPAGAANPSRRETRITRKFTSSISAARSQSSSTTSACSRITRAPTSRAIACAWRTMLRVSVFTGRFRRGSDRTESLALESEGWIGARIRDSESGIAEPSIPPRPPRRAGPRPAAARRGTPPRSGAPPGRRTSAAGRSRRSARSGPRSCRRGAGRGGIAIRTARATRCPS